jgi:1,4-alpha-glucan branching enzyme
MKAKLQYYFHMALDKFYGTEDNYKELIIDVCHQDGIAVPLYNALNHAFGRTRLGTYVDGLPVMVGRP